MNFFLALVLFGSAISDIHGARLRNSSTGDTFVGNHDFGLGSSRTNPRLNACQCNSVGDCDNGQVLSKQNELFLCVLTNGTNIANVEDLTFHQDGTSTFSTIVEGISNDVTWVVKEKSWCMIRTRLDETFYKPSFRGAKRKGVVVDGTITLQDESTAKFEMKIPLQTYRLTSYVSGHGTIIVFFILLLVVISAWAFLVTVASISRSRPDNTLSPDELVAIEEKRMMAIYSIWQQSQWYKPGSMGGLNEELSLAVSDTWSSSSSEEEKEEIKPYHEQEVTAVSSASTYAANNA